MRHETTPADVAPVRFETEAVDGQTLGATMFRPAGRALGTVLVHGATAVPQTYYRHFAAFLAARGMRAITYDYRGVGASRPRSLRGFEASMTDWARLDAAALHAHVSRRHRGEPLALVGHSFGGQLLGLIDEPQAARGALLVGAQLGAVTQAPRLRRTAYTAFMGGVVPALAWATGYVPGWAGLGEDLPAGVATEWARWCLDPEYLFSSHPDARDRFAALERPVLFYSISDDRFAPAASVAKLLRALSGAALEHRHIDVSGTGRSIGHFGYFRPTFSRRFWPDATAWLRALLTDQPLPRGDQPLLTEQELARDLGY